MAADADELKQQFLAVVSHELRTPLAAVVGYAGLLRMLLADRLTEKETTYLDHLMAQADQLQLSLNQLLDAASLQAGTLGLVTRRTAPADVIEEVHHALAPAAGARRQAFKLDLAPALPEVRADAQRLAQVVQALAGNALKFTPEGGHVALSACRTDGRLRVEVRDDGPGVAPADRPKLFRTFSQVDMSNTRPAGGLGLGLGISRALIEAMGGQLELAFPVEGGCVAWFELPALEVA
ncbi:MAG: multi-sensor hybrid histidine kinase [Cyanobacteria bacterium RYN_339]|nr:multi-sensor hybrid histidine kinase [Cyanobacteria bacterium RYN_339]